MSVHAGRLWAGGLATAAVAALTAVAGIVIIRGLLHVPVLAPDRSDASTLAYALTSGTVALAATALLHGLALTTPRFARFFTWIMALCTAIACAVPLGFGAGHDGRLATAVLNLVLGIAITTTLAAVGRTAIRR